MSSEARAATSPQDEFEVELQPILDKACAVAYRLAGNRDDAQELVQDAIADLLTL